MTAHRDLKNIIRDRQRKTGESYTAARRHVLQAQAELLGVAAEPAAPMASPQRCEAAILKVNDRSVRARILGESEQLTFRAGDMWTAVPGQIATLIIKERWTWRGDAYASGNIESAYIDAAKLGLVPLPLHGGELDDLRRSTEPYRRPDPYAQLWRKLTSRPRPSYEMDPIAWGAFPGADPEDNPTCDAAELAETGDIDGARELLMETLARDLRCIDAHAHLGNHVFQHSPERAILHYEVGMRIAELSLPPGFDGFLAWGPIYNRPYLRCLHGYGLCLWRLRRFSEAAKVFERILSLNPNDNQGVRFCLDDAQHELSWEDMHDREERAHANLRAPRQDDLDIN